MTIKKSLIVFLVPFALALVQNKMKACSMYKITVDGNTIVGCNHDAWLTTPKIWFENAKQKMSLELSLQDQEKFLKVEQLLNLV